MSGGLANRAHLVEYNAAAALGELPGGLAAGQSPTDHVNRSSVMTRHALTIATDSAPNGVRIMRRQAALQLDQWVVGPGIAAILLISGACSSARSEPETSSPNADQAWVQSVCEPIVPDTTGWRRYELGNVSISVPPQYKRAAFTGYSLRFTRGDNTSLTLALGYESAFHLLGYNRPGQVGCDTFYGGYETSALSWSGQGEYQSVARWQRLNEPDQRPSVQAVIRTRRLSDAIALRAALHTIRRASDEATASSGNPDGWLYSPCATDSVDDFTWTRYDLRAVRIRVPRDIRRVPVPEVNELHFQKGRAKMRLRLHNDASQLFAQYYKPEMAFKYCQGEMRGLPVEAVSLRLGTNYGFAARWPDADRGEWLSVVVTAPTLAEATALRRSLLTLTFPR